MDKIQSALKSLPFFAGLSPADLEKIISIGQERNYKKGKTIFSEGAPLEGLYILKEGLVKIYKLSSEGKEQILHLVNAGETFAGAPIFLKQPHYPAFAQTLEDSKAILIPKQSLFRLIETNPAIALKILESFSAYLNNLVELVESLSLKDVSRRLAAFLLDLAKEKGQISPQGISLPFKLTKQEIASRLGTVREVISRTLSRFQAKGLIKLSGKSIIILKESGLKAL